MAKKPITDWNKFREQFVRWTLRRASFRWPPRGEAMKLARVDRGLYKCAICGKVYKNKEVKVDHTLPVVDPEKGFIDWNTFIPRLFCLSSNLAVLCDPCHKVKTAEERELRKKHKTGLSSEANRQRLRGQVRSKETKKLISKALKGKLAGGIDQLDRCYEMAKSRRTPVISLRLYDNLTQYFNSVREAARELGLSPTHICAVCKGKEKQVGGYKFEYVK